MTSMTATKLEQTRYTELAGLRSAIERRLTELLGESQGERDLVANAMRASTLAPGKRIRPLLLLMAAQDLGCEISSVLDLGCAVEMVHAASLVLDDMPCMDNANLRRGRPTIHRHFGEDVAILAAIALLSRAFGLVAGLPEVSPLLRTQLVQALSDAVGMQGLVKGQYQDLREGAQQRSENDIANTNELKTGVLFAATLAMAALVAGAEETAHLALRGFALELGQAFQLLDDLQDGCTDSVALGKDVAKDTGKSTLVALLGPDAARNKLKGHIKKADAYLTSVYGSGRSLSQFMNAMFALDA